MTPEEFLDARFPWLKPAERSVALSAIRGERMPRSQIDGAPLMEPIREEWKRYTAQIRSTEP